MWIAEEASINCYTSLEIFCKICFIVFSMIMIVIFFLVLYNNEFSTITSVAWNQYDDNYLVAGTQAGDIYLLDKREPKDFISVLYCFSAPVNRISFKNSKDFAVCGDSKEVLVINSEGDNLDVVYKNEKHKGHVKGLAWYEDTLYSCGFGKSVINHVF